VELRVIDDHNAQPVAQTLPCLHSSQKMTYWIFIVTS